MNNFQKKLTAAAAMALIASTLLGAEKETLVVREVTVTQGIEAGNPAELQQVLGTLKRDLNARLSKKFNVLSRDLKAINEEAAISGDSSLKAAKYILNTTITGFTDGTATNVTETGVAFSRKVKLFGTADFIELNGKTLSSTSFSVSLTNRLDMVAGIALAEQFGAELVEKAPKEAARQIATSTFFYIDPPKVTDVKDKQVKIDWGQDLIAKGDKLEVFALTAKDNANPDEDFVGLVEITRVNPTGASGVISDGSTKIVKGCILRRPQ